MSVVALRASSRKTSASSSREECIANRSQGAGGTTGTEATGRNKLLTDTERAGFHSIVANTHPQRLSAPREFPAPASSGALRPTRPQMTDRPDVHAPHQGCADILVYRWAVGRLPYARGRPRLHQGAGLLAGTGRDYDWFDCRARQLAQVRYMCRVQCSFLSSSYEHDGCSKSLFAAVLYLLLCFAFSRS